MDEPLIRSQPGGPISVPKREPAPVAWCKRLRGGSVRDCNCKLPGLTGGWLECPPEARGMLSFAPAPPPPPKPLPLFSTTELIPEPRTSEDVRSIVATEKAELASMAKQRGYTGNFCDICYSTKMRRNGACEVCEDCGNSSGCS